MKNYKEIKTDILSSIQCDVCATVYDDIVNIQEFLSYSDTGGYGSIQGDGTIREIDICEKCQVILLGKYMRYS